MQRSSRKDMAFTSHFALESASRAAAAAEARQEFSRGQASLSYSAVVTAATIPFGEDFFMIANLDPKPQVPVTQVFQARFQPNAFTH